MMNTDGVFALFLIITNPGYSGATKHITTQEFQSRELCEWAKGEILSLLGKPYRAEDPVGVCLPVEVRK
ncbi:hypothetical protein [Paracoccus cavernae]|uniref:hypothetical protein n=1 Tax=Paracoccus cavernae TaxID=1571207 RepID=UPI0035F30CE3